MPLGLAASLHPFTIDLPVDLRFREGGGGRSSARGPGGARSGGLHDRRTLESYLRIHVGDVPLATTFFHPNNPYDSHSAEVAPVFIRPKASPPIGKHHIMQRCTQQNPAAAVLQVYLFWLGGLCRTLPSHPMGMGPLDFWRGLFDYY